MLAPYPERANNWNPAAPWLAQTLFLPVLGRQLGVDLNVFRWLVGVPLANLMPMFRWVAGLGS
jgi:hypothetical protein